jgi:hypothetical protein
MAGSGGLRAAARQNARPNTERIRACLIQDASWITDLGMISGGEAGGHTRKFFGEIRQLRRRPIAIDGLWALSFGTFAASDGDTLYFTAGIHDEADGLFGKLTAVAGRDR